MDFIKGVTNWEFLNEPLWRWFLFVIALSLMLFAWGAILSFMR